MNVIVGTGVSLSPATMTVPPRGTSTFTASGGLSTYTFSLATNASGGAIDATTGVYMAGATGGVTDVVLATDDDGNAANAKVVVGPGVSITPTDPSASTRGDIAFAAEGGNSVYTWVLTTNASGGSVDAVTGIYEAGARSGVTDVVTATDSLGNTGETSVDVTQSANQGCAVGQGPTGIIALLIALALVLRRPPRPDQRK